MQQSLNRFIDFFIKEKSLLAPEEIFQARTTLWLIVISSIFSLIVPILQIFGYFEGESALILSVFCAILLIISKFQGNITLASYLFIIGCVAILIANIELTGGIYSYNHKWHIVLLLFSSFACPRLTFPLLIFQSLFLFYSYSTTHHQIEGIPNKVEHLFDIYVALFISYLVLLVYKKIKSIQKTRIDNQNNQLLNQRMELLESNELLKQRSEQLLESNQELERFAYIASHDLKTPLNNIISFSNLLEKELGDFNNDNAHKYFSFIKSGSLKMNSLVKDVLEYSKTSSKDIEIEDIDLNLLINSINQSISEYIARKNAKVVIRKQLPIIRANRTKMYLLFKNLIENGIKYNESPTPLVEIEYNHGKDHVDIKVQDNGIGIAKKFHQNIFEMFSRLHRDNEYEGTGLGLALCKKIVDHLAGKISIQSQLEKGTQLIITLDKKYFPKLSL